MTQTGQPLEQTEALSPAARLIWLLLIIATLYFCYFYNLGVIGLVGPDEPRYAWIARDMAETGDWVTPRLYGKPWFEKPVLYYWEAALSFKLFGVSEVAARLPSAISALLATLAIAWLAWRIYGAETARWVLVLLPTTVGMIGFSHAAATDMPFAGMLTIAMVCAAVIVALAPGCGNSSGSKFVWFIFFGVFLGLSVLAKGPAAVILSGGAVLLWAAFTKRWRDAFRCLHPVAIASFCVTALPWYILCARRNPDFFRVFIIEHNFKRYLTPEFQHIQPFWFYAPVLLVAVFPWTIFVIAAFYRVFTSLWFRNKRNSTLVFHCCWTFFPLLFFTISRSKLPGYILPAVPALALFLAGVHRRKLDVLAAALSAAACAGPVILLSGHSNPLPIKLQGFSNPIAFVFGGLMLMFALWTGSLVLRQPPRLARAMRLCGFAFFLTVIALTVRSSVFDGLGISTMSVREAARSARAYGATPENLRLATVRRSAHYQFNFYFHGELKEWDGVANGTEFILGERISCSKLQVQSECRDLWGMIDRSDDWELLKVPANPH